MSIFTKVLAAVFALLIGVGVGYYMWGFRAADLADQLGRERSEHEQRLSEHIQRVKAAEDRLRQETDARKVLEEELNRRHPQK